MREEAGARCSGLVHFRSWLDVVLEARAQASMTDYGQPPQQAREH